MKKTALLFTFALILCHTIFAQRNTEFGIDFDQAIIWAAGGDRDYTELEILYRETSEEGDLRFRLSLLDRNFYQSDFIFSKSLTNVANEKMIVLYDPRLSFLAGIGMSKYMKENKLPIYYGADLSIGVSRGYANTFRTPSLEELFEQQDLIGSKGNHWLTLGFTPFLGVKQQLSDRLAFVLEFGLPANYTTGKVQYFDENQKTVSMNFSSFELGFPKFLNDVTVLYRL